MSKQIKSVALLSIVGVVAGLSGCVPHLSREQCLSMNWYQIGFQDGSHGLNQRDLQKDIQDCAQFQLSVDQKGYLRGWQAGVRHYCQPAIAYRLGTSGQYYNDICPSDLAPKFKQAWRRGLVKYCVPDTAYNLGRAGKPMPAFCAPDTNVKFRNAYDDGRRVYSTISGTQAELNKVNSQIADLNNQIKAKQDDIKSWQNTLNNGTADHATKKLARANIRDDYSDLDNLRDSLNRLSEHRDNLESQLNREKMQS